MTDRDNIALQSWWMGELSALTKRVMADEEKRQNRERESINKKLGDYQTKADIQDAYGLGVITEKKYDKLLDLWEKREACSYSNRLYEAKLDILSELYQTAKGVMNDCVARLNRTEVK